MGGGLAQAFLHRGFPTHVKDVSDAALAATRARIAQLFNKVCVAAAAVMRRVAGPWGRQG